MNMLYFSISLVAARWPVKLALAQYNTRLSKAMGAVKMGDRHYSWFVILHTSRLLYGFFPCPFCHNARTRYIKGCANG